MPGGAAAFTSCSLLPLKVNLSSLQLAHVAQFLSDLTKLPHGHEAGAGAGGGEHEASEPQPSALLPAQPAPPGESEKGYST